VTYGINQGTDAATSVSAHRIGRHSDAKRGVGSNQTLNVEGEVGGSEMSNVETEVGGECRVINQREKISRRMTK
jgi:hypothetical protein